MVKDKFGNWHESPVSDWFELSYAQYLTVPRSVLEQMPFEWQEQFAKLFQELDETLDWRPAEGRYWVQLRDDKGRYVKDPYQEYRHYPAQVPRLHKPEPEPK